MALVDLRDMLEHARRHRYAVGAFDPVSLEYLDAAVAAAVALARRATVPIALLADRCASFESAVRAINLGCNGIAVDAGAGAVPRAGSDRPPGDVARDYVTRTGIDVLAVKADTPAAEGGPGPERLAAIGAATGIPLAAVAARRLAARRGLVGGYCDLLDDVRAAIRAEAERLMQQFGAAGRAEEVRRQVRAGTTVEHLIIYNVQGVEPAQVEAMMARGREVLSAIPGVRRVFTGTAIPDQARYRFCWLVQFANARVIDSYRDHPDHVAFANQLLRPIAGDRISIDFAEAAADPPAPSEP